MNKKARKKQFAGVNWGLLVTIQILLAGILMGIQGENVYSRMEFKADLVNRAGKDLDLDIAYMPIRQAGIEEISTSAISHLVMDVDSAVVMSEKNMRHRLFPASTTKMMTALIALENYDLDREVTVPAMNISPYKIGLVAGEKIKVKDLLYGALVASGNDAAETLAAAHPMGREKFIETMNQRAGELHLLDTHFVNPTGFDAPDHYSTALDLARLAAYALRNPTFAEIVATEKTSIYSSDKIYEHKLTNINQLLGKLPGVKGVKTGYTEGSGETLVALAEREGHQILTVVLGSDDRFGETEKLIEWAFANYNWIDLASGF